MKGLPLPRAAKNGLRSLSCHDVEHTKIDNVVNDNNYVYDEPPDLMMNWIKIGKRSLVHTEKRPSTESFRKCKESFIIKN